MKIITQGTYVITDTPSNYISPKIVADKDFPLHIHFKYYSKAEKDKKQKVFKRSVYKLFLSDEGLIKKIKLPMGTYTKNETWCVDNSIWFHTKRDFDCFCVSNEIPIQSNTYPFSMYENVEKKEYFDPEGIVLPALYSFLHKAEDGAMTYKEYYSQNHLKISTLPKSKYGIDHVKDNVFYCTKYTDTKLYPSTLKTYLSDMKIIKGLIPEAKGIIISNVGYKGPLPNYIIVKVLDE